MSLRPLLCVLRGLRIKFEGDSIYNETSPLGRYAMLEEIAQLAVFMASDMGNLIVGDIFYITGGGGTVTLHN